MLCLNFSFRKTNMEWKTSRLSLMSHCAFQPRGTLFPLRRFALRNEGSIKMNRSEDSDNYSPHASLRQRSFQFGRVPATPRFARVISTPIQVNNVSIIVIHHEHCFQNLRCIRNRKCFCASSQKYQLPQWFPSSESPNPNTSCAGGAKHSH